ncbi:diacylglycerol kinase family protein [Paenibacillus hunanensis]|uniref:diacylglycerol kinase family protein n=1 Tax=Paenibacillus hunanensis TaxID=539262 RepID=UPI00202641C1|nr:diacylglycerol kinase family protein [Paenibacillus hunanensis]MCL9660555.1 diacylglycerol kinase family protein [Paenibacillus hunanensis]
MKKRTWRAVFYSATEGVIATFRTERNFRVHVLATFAIIAAAWFFHVSVLDWLLLTLAIGMVLGAELMNTAVEAAVDLVSPDWHPFAKKAKDAAAGAVLIASLTAAVIGIIIFWQPVLQWLTTLFG